ncbi:MAG: glycosyltransferase, partial [Candidatus Poseidoniaceae archaeon]|nr:glycosyltransferase [Candidatus Poseidoniaceae archaeon]
MAKVAMVVSNSCSPDPRVLRSAFWLVEAGHQVTIHAFDRLQLHSKSESTHGARIMRYHLGEIPYGGMGKTIKGILKFVKQVKASLRHSPPDLIYCHDADTLSIATSLKKSHQIPFVFDMHDLHHTWIRMPAPNSIVRKFLSRRMEAKMLRQAKKADVIITTSGKIEGGKFDGFEQYLQSKNLISTVVENRPLEMSIAQQKPSNATKWSVGYLGRVRELKTFTLMLEAIKLIPVAERPNIIIAGDGTKANEVGELMMNAVNSGEVEAEVSGAFTPNQFHELVSQIDVMFALYPPNRGNILQGALPVKMFDAAANGVPSIVNSDCLMGELAESEEIGRAVAWDDAQAACDALLELKGTIVELKIT